MQFRAKLSSCLLVFGLMTFFAPVGFAQNAPSAEPPENQAASSPPVNPDHPFPPADPRNFTADTPSKDTVDAFLRDSWGYDPNRIWQVQAILKTPVAGVSRVVVLVAEKGGAKEQTGQIAFFTLPDGNHIIADAVLPFGPKPFEENRRLLQSRANGPWRGASGKDLELVEFADFECPHCKEAESTMKQLVDDYPQAHVVFENFPLVQIHTEAFKAAAYGLCVAKISGNDAFFKFSDAVFAAQDRLTPESSDQTLKDAVNKAGADVAKVTACSTSQETKAAINVDIDLGQQVGVTSTPTLLVNGRGLPLGGIPYEVLRKIIDFQAQEDGVTLPPRPPARAAPSLK